MEEGEIILIKNQNAANREHLNNKTRNGTAISEFSQWTIFLSLKISQKHEFTFFSKFCSKKVSETKLPEIVVFRLKYVFPNPRIVKENEAANFY